MAEVDGTVQPKRAHQLAFLAAFRSCAIVTRAAATANISRAIHYLWLAEDEEYRKEFAKAVTEAGPALEEEIFRRGIAGVLKPVFHKGKVCGTMREFSDTLLIFAAKRVMPAEYRERQSIEHTGPDGTPLFSLDALRAYVQQGEDHKP